LSRYFDGAVAVVEETAAVMAQERTFHRRSLHIVVDRLERLSDIAAVAGLYTEGRIGVVEAGLGALGSTSAGCLRRASGHIDSVDRMQLHSVLAWPGVAACLFFPAYMRLAMARCSAADSLLATPVLRSF